MRLLARRFGINVGRLNIHTDSSFRLAKFLSELGVDLVIDVGANDGGFASELLSAGYPNKIVSYEPLPDAHGRLTKRAARYQGQWSVPPAIALSDAVGTAEFHRAGNSYSSSLLAMLTSHSTAAPESAVVDTIEVATSTADLELSERLMDSRNALLKIDVQGAEMLVLRGAEISLRSGKIAAVKVELSLLPLYQEQPLWLTVHNFLLDAGFDLWDLDPGFRDSRSGRLLQMDGFYVRSG